MTTSPGGVPMDGDILIHLTHGPDQPTQADRGFLIAQTAVEEGLRVAMFLAGSAVELMTHPTLEQPLGYGPPLRDRVERIISGDAAIHVSQVSCEARNVSGAQLDDSVILSPPRTLVALTMTYSKVITYG